ncbi:histidine kinase [Escherichia coli]|nr:histidine kinase [Escherichia coli]PSZ19770.1 histidine kinase [Escherichia sp. 4726-5]PTN26786.1 histidine kinase [Escherichia sp. MOD1-EC6475]EFC1526023.1 histidine kinase [Escherichia coli]EFC9526553.1 histidine kinase [Escherichia coli]
MVDSCEVVDISTPSQESKCKMSEAVHICHIANFLHGA